jgi:preprotein translocase subunit SecY
MKESTKKMLGIFSWVPLAIFTASVIYFMYVSRPLLLAKEYQQHEKLAYYLSAYYDSMFAWFFVGSVIGVIVLIYFCIHILRLKHMHPATKAIWFVFLTFSGSFGLPVFYYLELKNESPDIALHPSIE